MPCRRKLLFAQCVCFKEGRNALNMRVQAPGEVLHHLRHQVPEEAAAANQQWVTIELRVMHAGSAHCRLHHEICLMRGATDHQHVVVMCRCLLPEKGKQQLAGCLVG